ncbi:hypothetical protein AB3N04_00315 (plasmid) [Alkalihalophilus sp. As8PL]|uniref:Uncharacterized protein n=1 Tax=Alkalihalophilus sp. As8PL TaxID=3237103 RepID=A0AB39BP19_9BACI
MPHTDETIVSLGVAFAIFLWTAWKDNDITKEAIANKKILIGL